jgi:hypothetical protein
MHTIKSFMLPKQDSDDATRLSETIFFFSTLSIISILTQYNI